MSNLNKTYHPFSVQPAFVNNIFKEQLNADEDIRQLYHYQLAQNAVYRQWCTAIEVNPGEARALTDIPFLPISFFKTHRVVTGEFEPALFFESSGTTQTQNSTHYVKDTEIYRISFSTAFSVFYGHVQDWCIIGLLPAYLERQHSSLVLMVDELIRQSGHGESGFYLDEFAQLHRVLQRLEAVGQKVLLIGVTFALLDFAEAFPMKLRSTVIMETGGMKGRRKELTRNEVHQYLQQRLGVVKVHSEYGMTELLSQAYSAGDGRFVCPPWMKVLVRDEEDPLRVSTAGRGVLNVIDMANIHSCAFIATDDVGMVYEDGSFEVWGRLDNSDIRGCSLLVV